MNIDDPGPASLTVPEALEAIGNLAGLERRADPGVLRRMLLEHMIVSTGTATAPSSPAALRRDDVGGIGLLGGGRLTVVAEVAVALGHRCAHSLALGQLDEALGVGRVSH